MPIVSLANADADAYADLRGRLARGDPQRAFMQQLRPVETAIDRECFAQTPGSPAEVAHAGRSAMPLHELDTLERFQRPHEYGGTEVFRFARHVETIIRSVDEIDVRMKRREKHRCVARAPAYKCMRGRVADFVRFSFDDFTGDSSEMAVAN